MSAYSSAIRRTMIEQYSVFRGVFHVQFHEVSMEFSYAFVHVKYHGKVFHHGVPSWNVFRGNSMVISWSIRTKPTGTFKMQDRPKEHCHCFFAGTYFPAHKRLRSPGWIVTYQSDIYSRTVTRLKLTLSNFVEKTNAVTTTPNRYLSETGAPNSRIFVAVV